MSVEYNIEQFLTENKELNLNVFFKYYIDSLKDINTKKQKVIEMFNHSENIFKSYKEALNPLFAVTDEMNLKLLSAQEDELIKSLQHYVPDDIEANKKMINITIDFLQNIKNNIKTITDQFLSVEQIWKKRNIIIANDSYIINELEDIFKETSTAIKNFSNIDNIESVIVKITNLKNEINRIIVVFQKLNSFINLHVYIGEEEERFQDKLYNFVENKLQSNNISKILTEFDVIEKEFNRLKADREYELKAFELIKYEAINDNKIYYYSVDANGVEIKLSDIKLEKSNKVKIDKYIYVEHFPKKGIFEIEDLYNNMRLANQQIEASYEIDKKSLKMFIISIVIQIAIGILMIGKNLSLFHGFLLTTLLWLVFYFILIKQEQKISQKYKIPNFMILTKINFYIYSIGDFINIRKFNNLLFANFHNITNSKYKEIKLIKESEYAE